ncbi:MAG TPA: KR domain-containing protein, partial [Thermoanaerobaculia bacterium]|nr:KR domain-containing protein [Thermoanaerobaculia bacterium]
VARRGDMERVARLAADRFGGVHGIVHSAGVAGGGVIQLKTYARASQVLAPKVAGTLVLDEVFAGTELDFFLLCSSLASVLGGPGQVDYCAANAFLDAFAARERARGGRLTVAVGWDTWAEVGMAVNTAVPSEYESLRQESLRQGITPAEGADAFERILASGLSQVAVSTTDLTARIRQWTRQDEAVAAPASAGPPARHRRPELSTVYRAPGNETERIIAEIWQELLGVEPVGADDRFLDLGGHSLLAGQVVSRLRLALHVDLPMRTVFEASTLAELAQLVDLEIQGEGSPAAGFEPLSSPFGFAQLANPETAESA